MPFIPAPGAAEVNINQRLHGEQVQNTLYCAKAGPWTTAQLELLAGEVLTWVGTVLYPNLSVNMNLAEVFCRDLAIADGPQFTAVPTVTVAGGDPGPALPGNAALVVSFRTGLTGRSRRGRNYVAGIPENQATGNLVNPTYAIALRTAYEALNVAMNAAGGFHIVLSRFSLGLPRPAGVGTPVNAYLADPRIDSQRRRLQGRGS